MRIKEKKWVSLDKEWSEIEGELDLEEYLSPINRAYEENKTINAYKRGEVYNPTFEFEQPDDLREEEISHFITRLSPDDPLEELYYRAARTRLGFIRMIKTNDPQIVTEESIAVFGQPSTDFVAESRHLVETIKPEEINENEEVYNAESMAKILRKEMEDYGFDWGVIIQPEMGAKALVDNLKKEFWIRSDVKWRASLVKMVSVHEIGTHILRSENGYAQPLSIFGKGLPSYQITEEGLAEFTEIQHGCFSNDILRRIAGRVVGIKTALDSSFFNTFKEMLKYFDEPMAFDIVQRAKVGIKDTSKPGSFTKDYVYLYGLRKIEQFFKKNNYETLKLLYTGKIRTEDIPLCKALINDGFLFEPKILPDFIKSIT